MSVRKRITYERETVEELDEGSSTPVSPRLLESQSCGVLPGLYAAHFANYDGLIPGRLVIEAFNGIELYRWFNNRKQPIVFPHPKHDDTWIMQVQIRYNVDGEEYRHGTGLIIPFINGQRVAYLLDFFDAHPVDLALITGAISAVIKLPIRVMQTEVPQERNLNCKQSGYCLAYAMKYTEDYLAKRPFNPQRIRVYLKQLEDRYPVASEPYDYGWFDQPQNVGLVAGGVGGALLGGAVGGWGGALAGGALGAGGGWLLGKAVSS